MKRALVIAAVIGCAGCGPDHVSIPIPSVPVAPSPIPPAPPAVRYQVTFSADQAACAELPAAVRMRSYPAVGGTRYASEALILEGSTFFQSSNVLYARLSDSFASLSFEDGGSVAEMVTPNSYLEIYGGAEGPISNGPQSHLPMWAYFTFCNAPKAATRRPECSVTPITCSSNRHTLTLEKR
jgi:hypothetical protein